MEVRETQNAGEFLKLAEKFLMEHEAENNLVLGQAMRLARGEPIGNGAVAFSAVEEECRVLGRLTLSEPARVVARRGRGDVIAMIADWGGIGQVNLLRVVVLAGYG